MLDSDYKLSIVVTSRNDDFGKDMVHRLRLFTDSIMELGEQFGLSAEIIVVEWNPPDGPRLYDVLSPEVESSTIPIRFIEVPPEAHSALRNSDVLPLFQMIAKNVGIRRARGQYVLSTNQDILFSPELIRFLSEETLDPKAMYRLDRHDVEAEVPEGLSAIERMDWCTRNLIRVHGRHGTYPHWSSIRRRGIRPVVGGLLAAHPPARLLKSLIRFPFTLLMDFVPPRFRLEDTRWAHTNACGDFTLCARDLWWSLRAYAEIPIYSLHIDSLFCYSALGAGVNQRILTPPRRMFHLEHESSWAVMDTEEKIHWFAEKPWLDIAILQEVARHVHRTRRPLVLNPESWGLADWDLSEVTLLGGKIMKSGEAPQLASAPRGGE